MERRAKGRPTIMLPNEVTLALVRYKVLFLRGSCKTYKHASHFHMQSLRVFIKHHPSIRYVVQHIPRSSILQNVLTSADYTCGVLKRVMQKDALQRCTL